MELTREQVIDVFKDNKDQASVVIDLYKLVIPHWDRVTAIEGFPTAGKELDELLMSRFFDFDERHHPDVLKGGLWLNKGFSLDESLGDWEVSIKDIKITYDIHGI